jgi:hypothetical protein
MELTRSSGAFVTFSEIIQCHSPEDWPTKTNSMELIPFWEDYSCAATHYGNIMEPEDSLPCSQKPPTDPDPDPDEFNPYHLILSI